MIKLIQVLPYKCIDYKQLHNHMMGCTCSSTLHILELTFSYLFSYINHKHWSINVYRWNGTNKYHKTFLAFKDPNVLMFLLNIFGKFWTMTIYAKFITLLSHETFTTLGNKYITTTFDANTRKFIHVVAIFKLSTLLILVNL